MFIIKKKDNKNQFLLYGKILLFQNKYYSEFFIDNELNFKEFEEKENKWYFLGY